MRNHALYLCAASLILGASAPLNVTAAEESTSAEKPARPDYYPWTVGFAGGLEGILGLSGEWRFSDHVGVRTGFGWTGWSMSGTEIAGIYYNADVRLMGEPLTLNVYPWKKHSFYVGFGWLFNQNQLTGSASESGTIDIDGHPFPVESVGSLNMKVTQQPVNPYLAIGGNFFYLDHAHHWAIGGEMGVLYCGTPDVSLNRSGPPDPVIDAAVSSAQNHLQRWADQYKWLPAAMLKITFSF